MKLWPPSPTVILAYIAIVATAAAIGSGYFAHQQATDNDSRIDDIEQVQTKLCGAVTAISEGQNRNTKARLTLNDQFTKSPAVAAAFGLTLDQLKTLTAKSEATDKALVKDIQHAVSLACG